MEKITAVYFKENEDYHNMFFFFSDSKDQLEKIREAIEADGEVWSLDEYPLIIRKIIKNYKKYFTDNKYFFFRVMHDVDANNAVPVDDCLEAIYMFSQHNKALMYTSSENKYLKLIAEGVVRGVFDDISVDKVDIIEFNEDDRLKID